MYPQARARYQLLRWLDRTPTAVVVGQREPTGVVRKEIEHQEVRPVVGEPTSVVVQLPRNLIAQLHCLQDVQLLGTSEVGNKA